MELDVQDLRERCQVLAESTASPQMALVAAWLCEHLPEVAWNTVDDVAAQSCASPATVVRALQRLGFSGYSDLQARLRARLPRSELVWKLTRSESTDPGTNRLAGIVDQEKNNLDQLESTVGPDLAYLVPLLATSGRIFVTAALTTVPLAEHLATHLNLLLDNVRFMEAGTADGFSLLATLREGDLVIGLSFPRYAQATLDTLHVAAETHPTVVLTDRHGPEVPHAQLTLRLPSGSRVHFSSSVALVTLTMALAHLLHQEAPERVEANLGRVDQTMARLGLLHHDRSPSRGHPSDHAPPLPIEGKAKAGTGANADPHGPTGTDRSGW